MEHLNIPYLSAQTARIILKYRVILAQCLAVLFATMDILGLIVPVCSAQLGVQVARNQIVLWSARTVMKGII